MLKLMRYEGINGVRTFLSAEQSIGGQESPHSVRGLRKVRFTGNLPLRDKGVFEKISIVKFLVFILSAVSGTALAARVSTVVEAPLPAVFGDGVSSQEGGMPDRSLLTPGIVRLTFSVANAAATNSAVASFGEAGLDGGRMSLASTRFALVYDGAQSEWQLRHDGFRQRHAAAVGGTSLTATLRVDPSSGEPRSVDFSDNGDPVCFGEMDSTNAVLRSLFNFSDLGLVRVTSKNGAEATLAIEYVQEGTLIILR